MPIPNTSALCIGLTVTPNDFCITLPGPAEVCVHIPNIIPADPMEIVRQLFAELNAALAPLTPIFNIIDAVVAVFDCIKAASTGDVKEIVNCIPNLAEKIAALLQLIPLLTLPVLILQFIDFLILYLTGQQNQFRRMLLTLQRILAAELAATRPGNVGLAATINCARQDWRDLIQWFNEGNKPLNRLIGIINYFMRAVGLGKYTIPDVADVDPDKIEEALILFDLAIKLLQKLYNVIAPLAGKITKPFDQATEAIGE